MSIDEAAIRRQSLHLATQLGYATNVDLPALGPLEMRPGPQVFARMFCLYAVIAVSYGHPAARALRWLVQEKLTSHLSKTEKAFLRGRGDQMTMSVRFEALWAFAWAVGEAPELSFAEGCPDTLVKLMPDLRVDQPSTEFSRRWRLRSPKEVIEKLDLAYCLHWAIVDADLHRRPLPGKLHPAYVIQRRLALEWLMSAEDWDHVSLDT